MHSLDFAVNAFKSFLDDPPQFGVGDWHIPKLLAYADLRIRKKHSSGFKKGQYFSSTSYIIYERLSGEKIISFPYMEAHSLVVKIYEFLKKELDKRNTI